MTDEREPSTPAPLDLARAWAVALGREVRSAVLEHDARAPEQVLVVAQGNSDLMIRANGACIDVVLTVEISPSTRAHFAAMPPLLGLRALQALQSHLFLQPRTMFLVEPVGISSIAEIQRLTVQQRIRIGADDPGSFNRLADAMQEVAAAAGGAFARVGALIEAAGSPNRKSRGPPPSGMYA